jgi:hypothetical protein
MALVSILPLILTVVIGGLLLVLAKFRRLNRRGPSPSGAQLPKGSFGLPIVGESLSLVKTPDVFVADHVKR